MKLRNALFPMLFLAACSSNKSDSKSSTDTSATSTSTGSGGGSSTTGAGGGGGATLPSTALAFPTSPNIVVDQFGYLPDGEKLAIVRIPMVGYDAPSTYKPAATYDLVDTKTEKVVLSAAPTSWNGGATDELSGDQALRFDFSSVTAPGSYVVIDRTSGVRSYEFKIDAQVYREVLKAAVRTFYYQRAGLEKTAALAGAAYADGASHLGAGQDPQARNFFDKTNSATEKDVRGGWYDAGDYNKYTSWTGTYVVTLIHAFADKPEIWTDDYNIPESGNGIPDILDEAKWGMDWLERMQNADGSLLSIVGLASASPPSAATGASYYGKPSTYATLKGAAAFAYGASQLKRANNATLTAYADTLTAKAESAWTWAKANPAVIFNNNNEDMNGDGVKNDSSKDLGAGNQETDAAGRAIAKIQAAIYLFLATGKAEYQTYIDANYSTQQPLTGYLGPWNNEGPMALLDYAADNRATPAVAAAIKAGYLNAVKSQENMGVLAADPDPYGAYLTANNYTWSSNRTKSTQGLSSYGVVTYGLDASLNDQATQLASRYLHYLHGVNPMQYVYLTNMEDLGAEHSIQQIFHTWFAHGSQWDGGTGSKYAPPPGFLAGGPNPTYDVDGCCSSSCGTTELTALCTSMELVPPKGQPPTKSYLDFNNSWPLNSWSVTENSNGYQVAYILLLSKFVN